eukprot:274780-Rhodomonas_salina.1
MRFLVFDFGGVWCYAMSGTDIGYGATRSERSWYSGQGKGARARGSGGGGRAAAEERGEKREAG